MNERSHAAERDVEKRWSDPGDLRRPALYLGAVLLVALGVLVALVIADGAVVFAIAVPAVLGLGGFGALAAALLAYRRGRSWVQWQAVGWFLLTLMLAALMLPYMALTSEIVS